MAYNSATTANNKAEENFDRHLKLENPLSSDRKPVKIGNDSTGLLLEDNKVIIEDTLTVDGEAIVKDLTINNTLKLSANPADYATLIVADTGDLTIATVGDGTTDSDIKLHADGNIILTADSGFVGVNVNDPDEAFEVSGNIKFTSDGQQLRAADGNSLLREASNILYLGTPYQITFSDVGEQKGFWILDTDTREMEYIQNKKRMFYTIVYNDLDNNYNNFISKNHKKYNRIYGHLGPSPIERAQKVRSMGAF